MKSLFFYLEVVLFQVGVVEMSMEQFVVVEFDFDYCYHWCCCMSFLWIMKDVPGVLGALKLMKQHTSLAV